MTLRARLALGLLAIGIILLAPLLITRQALGRLDELTGRLRYDFGASLMVSSVRATADEARRLETALIVVKDTASEQRLDTALVKLAALGDSLHVFHLDTASQVGAGVRAAQAAALAELDVLQHAATYSDSAVDSISTARFRPALARVDGAASLAEAVLRQRTAQKVDDAARTSETARDASALAFLGAALLATLIATVLTQTISRPVSDLERGMGAVADGDFSYRLSFRSERADEFGRLAESFQAMSSQLAQLDRMKAEFVSVASHELKTPINVITGYLQLLEEGAYGELTARQREVCRTLEQQADALARLVRQLLDVSRFEAGGGKLEPRPTSLPQFLDDLEAAFNVLAVQRGITFRVVRDGGLPTEVLWDPDRVNEVIGNLLANAFKFTPRGGRVELRVHALAETVHMDVRDTGAGIATSQLPHVFKKFYQADNQSSASAKGTGLGLAIAKEIVEAHHGSIGVDSEAGAGTTFRITLPMRTTAGRRSQTQRAIAATP